MTDLLILARPMLRSWTIVANIIFLFTGAYLIAKAIRRGLKR